MNSIMRYIFKLIIVVFLFASCAKPIANFNIRSDIKQVLHNIYFQNQSIKANEYLWDFGDGTTSKEFDPLHEYKLSGNYKVTLKAINGNKVGVKSIDVNIDPPTDCMVEIETDFGNMVVLLYNATPRHRDNFIKLAEQSYYNELIFHRVINGFMIQGGDPNSKNASSSASLGSGGPGYQIPAELVDTLIHVKGALAAARTGDQVNPMKESSGSQFYIVHGRPVTETVLEQTEAQKNMHYSPEQKKQYETLGGTPFLDKEYTVFGKVIKGLDVIDKIAGVQTGASNRPFQDVKMKIRVIK